MPLLIPSTRSQQQTINYSGRPSITGGTNVVSSGTAHVLSSTFTELLPAIAHDCFWLTVFIQNTRASNTRTDALLNIYLGATSAETLFIDSLLAGWSPAITNAKGKTYNFPVYIPAGTRISAKSRSLQVSKNIYVGISVQGGGEPIGWVGRGVETLGQVTASSKGTDVTPGGASEGTFTSIGTSGFEYKYVTTMLHGNIPDTTQVAHGISVDFGTGSALLKDLQDFRFGTNSAEHSGPWSTVGRWTTIPSATALQLRAQSEDATVEASDYCIYGVY